jgi:hypothetical protein
MTYRTLPTLALVPLALVTLATMPAAAEDVVATAPIVTGGDTTIVYVFPTSPQKFAPIDGLPSFLAMPGSPLPAVATQVVYTAPQPVPPAALVSGLDVDCSNFSGEVRIAGPDRFDLDKDGDGIGCGKEDR